MRYNEKVYRLGPPQDGDFPDQGGSSDGGLVGALVNVGAGLYDSYQNRKASRENTDKTLAAQKHESELAYQRSVEMWHLQNAYNSPQQQMARFQAGGLNPNLIYGQGNAGNASAPPTYQPANLQYRYEAPAYGAAIQSLLPTLMSVGTWMQNMRLSEMQINKGTTDTERSRQMIDYLLQANPKMLEKLDNSLSLYPYQASMLQSNMGIAHTELAGLQQEFRHKFGEGLFEELTGSTKQRDQGGIRRLQFLQEAGKLRIQGNQEKIAEAKASYTDMNITDPQAIMQMVFGSIMGLAGQTLRLSTHKSEATKNRRHQINMKRR